MVDCRSSCTDRQGLVRLAIGRILTLMFELSGCYSY